MLWRRCISLLLCIALALSMGLLFVSAAELDIGTGTLRISKYVDYLDRGQLVLEKAVNKDTIEVEDGRSIYPLTYTITVTNISMDFTAENVIVTDVLPDNVYFRSASAGDLSWIIEPTDGEYVLGDIQPGGTVVLSIVCRIYHRDLILMVGDTIENIASVSNDTIPDPEPVSVWTDVIESPDDPEDPDPSPVNPTPDDDDHLQRRRLYPNRGVYSNVLEGQSLSNETSYTIVHKYYIDGYLYNCTSEDVDCYMGSTINVDDIPKIPEYDSFIFNYIGATLKSDSDSDEITSFVCNQNGIVIVLRYDYLTDENTDGILDIMQYLVTYEVENGTAQLGQEDPSDSVSVWVIKRDNDGNPSMSGVARLTADDIPVFTADDENAVGKFYEDEPVVGMEIDSDTTFLCMFMVVPDEQGISDDQELSLPSSDYTNDTNDILKDEDDDTTSSKYSDTDDSEATSVDDREDITVSDESSDPDDHGEPSAELLDTLNADSENSTLSALSDETDVSEQVEFPFLVMFRDSKGNELKDVFEYTGSKSGTVQSGDIIYLAGSDTIDIVEIPAGTRYFVSELQTEGYALEYCWDNAGVIEDNEVSNAQFQNKELIPGSSESSLFVLKVWDDNNDEAGCRPRFISVDLLEDGIVKESVHLNIYEDWGYVWTGLSPDKAYSVVEKGIYNEYGEVEVLNNYDCDYTTIGNTVIITNTYFNDEERIEMPGTGGNIYNWVLLYLSSVICLAFGVFLIRYKVWGK